MKKNNNMMFFIILLISSLMIMINNMWFMMWIFLEINLISFIFLMMNFKNYSSLESCLIYFLIQTIASILLMSSMLMMIFMKNMKIFISFSLMMKLGMAPFHFWMIMMIDLMSWNMIYLLLTWQKIAPLMIFYYYNNFNLMTYFLIMSMIIGSIMGLNYSSLKKILTYSSINQLSWILMSLLMMNKMFKLYMFMYMYMMYITIYSMIKLKLKYIYMMMMNKNVLIYMFIFCNLLSLGGLPPFIGFFPKMMIINLMNNSLMMIMMILCTLITLFYYIKIMISTMLMSYMMMNKNNYKIKLNKLMNLSMISNLSLMLLFILY